MFSENALGYVRYGECYSFQTFTIVVTTPENLSVGISGSLGKKESHFESKCVF